MPDHVHVLIEGQTADSDLLRFVKMYRQRSGRAHRVATGARLWQEGYFDRFLRTNEATLDVVRYIAGNPLRKGLCDDPRSYPYFGSSRYTIDELFASLA
jgi:REP element-mobilizing transposase RayT